MAKNIKKTRTVYSLMVLNILSESPQKALNYKQISSKLDIKDDELKKLLLDVLIDEVKKGNLIEPETGKFQIKNISTITEGTIDMTTSGAAYFVSKDIDQDLVILPDNLGTALHGDTVKVSITKRYSKTECIVLEVIKRKRESFSGIIKIQNSFGIFIPDDKRILHDFFIPAENLNNANNEDKVLVSIVEWQDNRKNPIGKITSILGKAGENNAEMLSILNDFGFPLSFPKNVEDEANAIDENITADEIKKRKDFRNITTFTIDPIDAKDFDDALSFRYLDNGNFEVGVHIADVSHYVLPGTELDKEATLRATSVYLVDRTIPMLPERLSNGLCSLRPNEDKLTFSAVFELDPDANIISQWFGRTIIHSDKRFSYEEAQDILDSQEGIFVNELNTLNKLAYKLRDAKFKAGAINFESTEVRFRLDENAKPIGVYVKERKDAHKLIEDFMLLANKKVAEYVACLGSKKYSHTFVYRIHDSPDSGPLSRFSEFAARFGYKISMKNPRDIADSLNKLMHDVEGKGEQNVLTQLAIRSMAKAIYTTKSSSHYGLAFDYYTHFTSPIRRYPDVMVHRLLALYLNNGKSADATIYEALCEHSSMMEKKAADAERASIKYKQAEYLEENIGEEYDGIVSGVTEWGMYVEIKENKCEGMIRLREINDDFYMFDEDNFCIIGKRTGRKFLLGDEVKIKVKAVNVIKRQIDFSLVLDNANNQTSSNRRIVSARRSSSSKRGSSSRKSNKKTTSNRTDNNSKNSKKRR